MRTKFMLALLGVALITAAVANVSWSETGIAGIIKGSVMDKRSGQPLPLANIVLEGTTMGAATGADGSYIITDIPAGEYNLTVSMMGYEKMIKIVKVFADQISTVNIELEEAVLKGELIVVTATKTKHLAKDVPVVTSVITKEEIEAANIQTVQHALRNLSGIQVNESYGWGDKGKVELQGLDGRHTLVLVDGQRVCGGHQNAVDLQAYPVDMIERIEVVRGPASSLYGSDAIGGVVNIISRSAPPRFTFSASPAFGSRNRRIFKATHGFRKDKFGYFFNYTHRESEGRDREVDEYDENALQGSVQYHIASISKLTLKPYYSLHRMKESDREQERYSLNSMWEWKPDKVSNLSFRGSLFNYDHSMVESGQKTGWSDRSYELELNYNRLIRSKHLVTGGYHFHSAGRDDQQKDFEESQTTHSFYLQDEADFEPLTFVLGARIDGHDRWGTEVNPKVSLLCKITEHFRLRGSIGRAFRGPSLVKLYAEGWRMGPFLMHANPVLEPEKSIGYQFGAEWRVSEIFQTNLSFFRNEIEDMISSQYTRAGRPPWDFYFYNTGEARTQGIELNLASQLMDNLSAKLGYTFLDTEDKITGKELPYKSKHSSHFGFYCTIPNVGLEIGLNGRYVGRRYEDEENAEKLSDYAVADLSIIQKVTSNGQVFLRIDNVFDKKDVEDAYLIDGTELLCGLKISY